jgi:hypothetical protein
MDGAIAMSHPKRPTYFRNSYKFDLEIFGIDEIKDGVSRLVGDPISSISSSTKAISRQMKW